MRLNQILSTTTIFVILAVCWTTVTWAVPQEDITFELTKPIELADGTKLTSFKKSEIESIQDLPIYIAKFKTATLTNKERKQIQVRTCREYDTALEQGYQPDTNADIISSAWLKYPCSALRLLKQASKPKHSVIPKSKKELYSLKLLPLKLFPVLSDFEQTYGYDITNDTYQDRADAGFLKTIKPENGSFNTGFEDDGLQQYLTEVTRTDFNNDGFEDILLYEAVYIIGASYRAFDIIILTRKAIDSPYTIMLQDGALNP